jgi:glycosyltransferase involved in cell wall biosynthesis
MLVSCLTVTQEGRLEPFRRALDCFRRQRGIDAELVVVHDGGAHLHETLAGLADSVTEAPVRVHQEPPGQPLGALRNRSLALAEGDLVCQWDDDDLYHPDRLRTQFATMRSQGADFCFLTDQLHLFTHNGELYWDDWRVERYPMNLIQGTLFGRRDRIGSYPDLARGEDTPVMLDLVRRGCRIAALAEHAWLYVYVFHGTNAWDFRHHAAIALWKRLRREGLEARRDVLLRELAEYEFPVPRVIMPFEGGSITIRSGETSGQG